MKVVIHDDADTAAAHTAVIAARSLQKKPSAVLGLATGETMRPVYRHLRDLFVKEDIPTAYFTSFNLDEFIGVPPSHPGSFHYFMAREFLDFLDNTGARCFLPDGMAPDPMAEAARYETSIKMHGGIDLQLLGIGRNGHIGFNEPGTAFDSRTSCISLSDQTISALQGFAPDVDYADLPKFAITMGIATIMDAKRCVLLATGSAKASAIRAMLDDPVSIACPASVLRTHLDVTIILDRMAAEGLTEACLARLQPIFNPKDWMLQTPSDYEK